MKKRPDWTRLVPASGPLAPMRPLHTEAGALTAHISHSALHELHTLDTAQSNVCTKHSAHSKLAAAHTPPRWPPA